MITSAEDLVIVVSPPLLAMVAAIVLCNVTERVFRLHGIARVLSWALTAAFIVASVFAGAKYQEILLVLLALSVLQIYAIKANGSRVREEDKAAQKEERREREE